MKGAGNDMTWLWRLLIGSVISCVIGASAWSMTSIVDFPKEYASKKELLEQRKENRQDHKEILKKIDRILERL